MGHYISSWKSISLVTDWCTEQLQLDISGLTEGILMVKKIKYGYVFNLEANFKYDFWAKVKALPHINLDFSHKNSRHAPS